jgi:hypothetical protein
VLSVASLLFSLGLAEAVVRLFGLAPQLQVIEFSQGAYRTTENPLLPYIPNPGRGLFNSLGLRDRERSPVEVEQGRPRVVALGDSVLFGGGVDLKEIFAIRLERELQKSLGAQAQVFNLGVPGYNTRNEVEYYKLRGAALRPDLILVAYCLNDAFVHSTELAELLSDPRYASQRALAPGLSSTLSRGLFIYSHFFRLLGTRLSASLSANKDAEDPLASHAAGRSAVREALAELVEIAKEQNIKVHLVVFPYLFSFSDYPMADEHKFIRALAFELGISVTDLFETFRGAVGNDGEALRIFAPDFIHLNPRGHQITAQVLSTEIRTLLSPRDHGDSAETGE